MRYPPDDPIDALTVELEEAIIEDLVAEAKATRERHLRDELGVEGGLDRVHEF